MNALNIASVTATALTGTFHQPVIVPPSLDDRQLATAGPPVGHVTRSCKRHDAGHRVLGHRQGGHGRARRRQGAKTGSAEVDGQATSNSWFTGFSDDLAAAAVVQSGGHGGDAAGPMVAAVLRAAG